MKLRQKLSVALIAALPLCSLAEQVAKPGVAASQATQLQTLKDVAQKAVLNNPEVLARFHTYRAAVHEKAVARGGFFPRVDLTAGAGRESLEQPGSANKNYNRQNHVLSLSQMVFDGFATSNDVKRLDKASMARFYELLDASETAALEAARAYYDVMRYRFLVNLAEDNYVQHKMTYEQLVKRTQSGVGRRADMEQAGSRLALAESNLTTELANLHDVTARYQRIVGDQPPKTAFSTVRLAQQLPSRPEAAIERALQRNPSLLAAIENLESSLYDIEARRAAYMPRVDVRARTDNTNNYLGTPGDRQQNVVELVLNYNLFNGGSDLARERQYSERRYLAQDLRDKACRDMRQTLVIAYNDTARLKEQSALLETQVSLLEKTRDAYRDQFNVGQRSLLDLLDTENELLNARRSAVNADIDWAVSYLRAYAGMGELLETLGLKRIDTGAEPEAGQLPNVDLKELCPAEAPIVPGFDREALDARAVAMMQDSVKASGASAGSQAPFLVAGAEAAVAQQVKSWAGAWGRKDYSGYASFYAPSFLAEGGIPREEWLQRRQGLTEKTQSVNVEISNLRVRQEGPKNAVAEFRQVYVADGRRDVADKVLLFTKVGDRWLIENEKTLPVLRGKGAR